MSVALYSVLGQVFCLNSTSLVGTKPGRAANPIANHLPKNSLSSNIKTLQKSFCKKRRKIERRKIENFEI